MMILTRVVSRPEFQILKIKKEFKFRGNATVTALCPIDGSTVKVTIPKSELKIDDMIQLRLMEKYTKIDSFDAPNFKIISSEKEGCSVIIKAICLKDNTEVTIKTNKAGAKDERRLKLDLLAEYKSVLYKAAELKVVKSGKIL